ncbi:hypothetical protein HF313_17075 [Massilia atriviolacea]|uniref:Uncharacterized protein n=1 Tax=Massilia atriviolacea TaxID=2495579 RepID=A0A430HU55_9BURK|nr:hypothetical protein [Massilia atriviolacea]RSZ60995.1 hypothetical protein EJB06_02335 [Massilia atriviolacea]
MDQIEGRAHDAAAAAVVLIGKAAYSVNGVGVMQAFEMVDLLAARGAGHIAVRIAPEARTDFDRIGKLIFALARQGWQADTPDSMHWTLKPADTALAVG